MGRWAKLIWIAGAALAAPSHAATVTAAVTANFTKPLVLSSVRSLDLGTIMLVGPGTWSGATVGISRNGVFSCSDARLSCTGLAQSAQYRVEGTNKATVSINAPNVVMTNASDPTQTLTLVIDNPGTIVIPNSGNPGIVFALGGSITLGSETPSGNYNGVFNVTVDY